MEEKEYLLKYNCYGVGEGKLASGVRCVESVEEADCLAPGILEFYKELYPGKLYACILVDEDGDEVKCYADHL